MFMGRYSTRFRPCRPASFRGKHNITKSKVLLILNEYRSPLSVRALAHQSHTSYDSLRSLLPKWTRWGYVLRRQVVRRHREIFVYRISARGCRFVNQRLPVDLRRQLEHELKIGVERPLGPMHLVLQMRQKKRDTSLFVRR
jgi:hypothetical protein